MIALTTIDVDAARDEAFRRALVGGQLPKLRRRAGVTDARGYAAVEGQPRYLVLTEFIPDPRATTDDSVWPGRLELSDAPGSATRSQTGWYEPLFPTEGLLAGSAGHVTRDAEGGLLVVRLDIALEHEEEFEEWYATEHLPGLCAVTGVIGGQTFRAAQGTPKYAAIYHLVDPTVQANPEWERAAATPWTMRMRRLVPSRWRVVYQPLREDWYPGSLAPGRRINAD